MLRINLWIIAKDFKMCLDDVKPLHYLLIEQPFFSEGLPISPLTIRVRPLILDALRFSNSSLS